MIWDNTYRTADHSDLRLSHKAFFRHSQGCHRGGTKDRSTIDVEALKLEFDVQQRVIIAQYSKAGKSSGSAFLGNAGYKSNECHYVCPSAE